MKKINLFFIVLMVWALVPNTLRASTNIDATTTITWPFNLGTAGQLATFSEGTADYFSTSYVEKGSNLFYVDTRLNFGITFTRLQPTAQLSAASTDGMLSFNLRTKKGLTFTPTLVTFDCVRYGTSGGLVDVVWKSTDGTRTTLATALPTARDNTTDATHASFDLSSVTIPASSGLCALEIYVYTLGNTKQIGFANVVVTGKTQGTPIPVVMDTLTTVSSPVEAGTITVNPVGTVFEDSSSITLTANRNFGYHFAYWATSAGDSVSGANPYTLTMYSDTALTAVFRAINTYSLAVNLSGGAKDYMVKATPSGTMVDGKLMYEDSTVVTLASSNNPILNFSDWSSGETTANLTLTMDQNHDVTANYKAIDYLVGWDLYKTGNGNRMPDFFSKAENDSSLLILRDSLGTVTNWLDKSQMAAGGYEGAPAAVNWSPLANKNYYQIRFSAKNYIDIKVQAKMLYNYNAYSVQRCEYSLNDSNYTTLGVYTMTSPKVWYNDTLMLPASANHADTVYIRWIPDYSSSVVGTASANDGTAISGIYVTGKEQVLLDEPTTITWPFGLGTADQLATFSEGSADYFSTSYVENGSSLPYKAANTTYNITFTQFQPTVQLGAASADGMVSFNFRPKTGLTFTPNNISFNCLRYGTDGGSIDVVWKSSNGTRTTLATALKPARNNSGAATSADYDLSTLSIPASDGLCALELYVYGLGNTKQVGLANVIVKGQTKGSIVDIVTHTLTTASFPEIAGTVSSMPVGTVFDDSTSITLTAKRNFGYQFAYWATEAGDSVSAENPYTFSLTSDTALTAIFHAINTYSLTVNTAGGAKSYMVTATPAATMINGKMMYEDGTVVTLSTANNPVLTFTNWSSGETSANLIFAMTKDLEVTANYSAIDYLVGWDFYKTGNGGRTADFFANSENESAALVLRDSSGTATTWLDKSQMAAGGYEGLPAAVSWTPLANRNYYQISFVAKDYSDLQVQSKMLYNYNAYSVQRCEYSLDGIHFDTLGTYTMSSAKVWYANIYALPAQANHAERVYIRWIPNYASPLVGTVALNNDGTALSAIYVTGTATILNDGVAPVLVSTVPADAAIGSSATGKIVLTFDEKVKLMDSTATATLGTKVLMPVISGKTITFPYTGLDYNTTYTFHLNGNLVADLSGNTKKEAIELGFTTMNKPLVTKKLFDFIVGVDGDFKAALAAAQAASSKGERFYIFFPNGQYDIGVNTGDANQMTAISIPKVSYIGENPDSVVVFNKSIQESINSTATMYFTSAASNVYMQDVSLMNKMDYRTGTLLGRGVALWDQGKKNIYKNVRLLSNQDTYYTGSDRSYLENCHIHGTVDFICGGGDIFFNECLLYLEERPSNCLTAPATNSQWGYVFNNCTIDGFDINNGSYRLGRPWSNAPKAVYINTTMKVLPSAVGWGDPMNVVPAVFAEYNSMTTSGASVDLSSRRTSYTKDATTVNLNPVLTTAQAAQYTIENVLGGTDIWQPNLSTEQASVPVVTVSGSTLHWDESNYVLCWAVSKNGSFVKFVTTNSYDIPAETAEGTLFTVRAANEMGGLSAASNSIAYLTTSLKQVSSKVVSRQYFSLDGRALAAPVKGLNIIRTRYDDGSVKVTKEMRLNLSETR